MGRLYDVSLPLRMGMAFWPGTAGFIIRQTMRIASGDSVNNTAIECDSHIGTHIDAPLHFLDGADSVEQLDIATMIGECFLAHIPGRAIVTSADLDAAGIPDGVFRLIIKTDNSSTLKNMGDEYRQDFVSIDLSAAQWIVERKMRLVGIDSLSIEMFGGDGKVHRHLMEAGMVILEGLKLDRVKAGTYRLYCLPLKLEGAEGAPARVVLEEGE